MTPSDLDELEPLFDVPPTSAVLLSDDGPSRGKNAREHLPAYAPCPRCGVLALTGKTDSGEVVALDPSQRTYVVLWPNKAQQPDLKASGAYPVHQCRAEDPRGED